MTIRVSRRLFLWHVFSSGLLTNSRMVLFYNDGKLGYKGSISHHPKGQVLNWCCLASNRSSTCRLQCRCPCTPVASRTPCWGTDPNRHSSHASGSWGLALSSLQWLCSGKEHREDKDTHECFDSSNVYDKEGLLKGCDHLRHLSFPRRMWHLKILLKNNNKISILHSANLPKTWESVFDGRTQDREFPIDFMEFLASTRYLCGF